MAKGDYSEFTEYAVDSAVEGGNDDSESDEIGWDDISTEVQNPFVMDELPHGDQLVTFVEDDVGNSSSEDVNFKISREPACPGPAKNLPLSVIICRSTPFGKPWISHPNYFNECSIDINTYISLFDYLYIPATLRQNTTLFSGSV